MASCHFYFNLGDALNYFFTFQLVSYDDVTIVSFTLIQLQLSNALNQSVMNNLGSAMRLNSQLKRYDRVFGIFKAAFIVLFFNFAFQIITFSIRNVIFNLIFMKELKPSNEFYHASLDGIFGTFNAFTVALIRSEQKQGKGIIIGTFKLIISVGIWFVAKYTNQGNSHFSAMLYFYKYCVDIIGLGFYVLIFAKYRKLKLNSKIEEQQTVQHKVELEAPKLVLQQIKDLENISRNTSTDRESKSKEITTSRDIQKSSKQDVFLSQSWALEENKE
ncbi:Hypothetical_protein [Hexamita inflata]|uniref:Hypothetical_protein n=1 Tax=Hexamita inflata TaxID=28002 RepID=A0ABP1GFF1_9EUKA